MKIIRAYPPNYNAIAGAFPFIKGRPGILYAWGDRIYNPSGADVPFWIMKHEETHGLRQQSCRLAGHCDMVDVRIEDWWDRYIAEPQFRLQEELAAHREEWKAYISRVPNQKDREMYLTMIAQRLSGKLYGSMVNEFEAKRLIQEETQ